MSEKKKETDPKQHTKEHKEKEHKEKEHKEKEHKEKEHKEKEHKVKEHKEKEHKEKKEVQLLGKKRNEPNEEELPQENPDKKSKNLDPELTKELEEMKERNKLFIQKCEAHPLKFIPPENPEIYPDTDALKFEVVNSFNNARAGILTLPHGVVYTPIFMPVGTKGCMKGLLSEDLNRMGCKLMLSNTYHLGFEPGGEFLQKNYGQKDNRGLHHYMNWPYNILTDSGGFQIASLTQLSERKEEGVDFISHIANDNRHLKLTPEMSINIQNEIGSDIIMALDDVISPFSSGGQVYDACERSLRWLDRCIKAHKRKNEQNLYGIVQGGINIKLREEACKEWKKRNLPGYAIGGMSGGETKDQFCDTIKICTNTLPDNKPRYLMGIGYPVDLVICALLGVDQFDCVFPTRTARFGSAFTDYGFLKLKSEKCKYDFKKIDEFCECECCKKYTRSYLYFLINNNAKAAEIISFHNVYYLLNLMKRLRKAIIDGKVNEFVKEFITKQYKDVKEGVPGWVYRGLKKAGCDVDFIDKVADMDHGKNDPTD